MQGQIILHNLCNDFKFFVRLISKLYFNEIIFYSYFEEAAKFILEICEKPYGRGILNFPPRHGKTTLLCVYFPAWLLLRNPNYKIIYIAYSDSFSAKQSAQAMKVYLAAVHYLRELGVSIPVLGEYKQSVQFWGPAHGEGGGYLLAAGRHGTITGMGCNLMIIDDLFKDAQEARSETIRNKIEAEWDMTYKSRLEGSASVMHCATRLHIDDLAGRLLAQGGWDRKIIKAEDNGIFSLDRFEKSYYENIKSTTSVEVWESLYQQNPIVPGGNFFDSKTFKYFSEIENGLYLVDGVECKDLAFYFFVDTALKEKETSDYFVCLIASFTEKNDILIFEVIRERAEVGGYLETLKELFREWKPYRICVEDKTGGTVVLQELEKETYPVFPLKARGSKVDRAEPIRSLLNQGKVYFRKGADYLNDFEAEVLQFPKGKHDDQVDCLSYAGIYLAENKLNIRKRESALAGLQAIIDQ